MDSLTRMGEMRTCGDVLLVPIGLQGHVTPLMYVANRLMNRGLTMTMILSEDDQSVMKEHMGAESKEGFHLELLMSPKKLPTKGDPGLLGKSNDIGRVAEPFLNQVLAEQQAGGEGPKCMIADQFMGWTQSWATKLQIPRYVVICSPATFGYTMYNHSSLIKKGLLDVKDEDPLLNLPGTPPIRLGDLSGSAKSSPTFITSSGDTFGEAAGMLFNTFYELESATIDAFDAQVKSCTGGKGPKMLPVGPMLPPEFFSEDTFAGTASESECIQWLNTRPASSVVYVAFGSMGYLSEPQIQELANGLEASKQSFLWVLRVKASDGGIVEVSKLLPAGFQERTKDQGFIYSQFAPQLQILSHPATGGFLSHCGWNSSLESICRGVPMIGWPLAAEQKLCCRVLLAAKVATAIRAELTSSRDLVKSDEVAKALRLLMTEAEGKELKTRASEMQHKARTAVAKSGSTFENFETLVKDIQARDTRILQTQ